MPTTRDPFGLRRRFALCRGRPLTIRSRTSTEEENGSGPSAAQAGVQSGASPMPSTPSPVPASPTPAVVVIGIVSERLTIRPIRSPTPVLITLVSIGLAIASKSLVMLTLGKKPMGYAPFSGQMVPWRVASRE